MPTPSSCCDLYPRHTLLVHNAHCTLLWPYSMHIFDLSYLVKCGKEAESSKDAAEAGLRGRSRITMLPLLLLVAWREAWRILRLEQALREPNPPSNRDALCNPIRGLHDNLKSFQNRGHDMPLKGIGTTYHKIIQPVGRNLGRNGHGLEGNKRDDSNVG